MGKREYTPGCVLLLEGGPADITYFELRDLCSEYGNVRFVEFKKHRPHRKTLETSDSKTADASATTENADAEKDQDESKAENTKEEPAVADEAKDDVKVDTNEE